MLWLEFEVDAVDRNSAADYLESVAECIRQFPNDCGVILDANGLKVGLWSISPLESEPEKGKRRA